MSPFENVPTDSFPYRVEKQVGVGSMGVVYQATDVELERTVAIKVLRKSVLDEEASDVQEELRRRFLQEARAAASLSHPGVTTVYRVGEEGGLPYMVMEWLDGSSLEEILRAQPQLGLLNAVRLVVALLDTLDFTHRHGVVHRDIKPSNLVVLKDGRLKVTDFGIALLKGRELVKTQAGIVLATPKFASPEQLKGIEVDGRADLFATGILLYHVLTGTFPFEGEGFTELANAILQEEPIPVRERQPDVPPAIEAIIRRALRKNRADRFSTASQMAEQLRPFLQTQTKNEPAAVDRPSTRGRTDTERLVPVLRDLPLDPHLAAVRVADSWLGRDLPRQSTETLLARLLEKPLHAPAFAGAVRIDDACLFIADGMLLGAVDTSSGESGDTVAETLPEESAPRLLPVPEPFPSQMAALLATVLYPPIYRHADLDSSFINLPGLAKKLNEEKLDGILRLHRGDAFGLVFFASGNSVLSAFSQGWDEVPVERSWQTWVDRVPVRASVEEVNLRPLNEWFRRTFRGLEFEAREVAPSAPGTSGKKTPGTTPGTTSSRLRRLLGSTRSTKRIGTATIELRLAPSKSAPALADASVSYEQAPAFKLLSWAMEDLQRFFADRERTANWKYLSEWIPLVRKAYLHYDLPRPGTRESDAFDLVTTDEKDKVLHLGQRMACPTPECFRSFLDRVVTAKKARIKTGDVGGVLVVAPSFSDEVLEVYQENVQGASTWFGVEESFTGYAGFVRIGARRGFHLLLVEETNKGFSPLT